MKKDIILYTLILYLLFNSNVDDSTLGNIMLPLVNSSILYPKSSILSLTFFSFLEQSKLKNLLFQI